jgi:hypothetical protein
LERLENTEKEKIEKPNKGIKKQIMKQKERKK